MGSRMPFVKMHGLGNDFILLDGADLPRDLDLQEAARRLCDRHFGIGADGLILLLPAEREGCALKWRFFNPDGSEPEMCGNGIRCFARYAYDRGYVKERSFCVETLAGPIAPLLEDDLNVRVDMGPPYLLRGQIPMTGDPSEKAVGQVVSVHGREYRFTAVSMGNPHCVIFVEDAAQVPLEVDGPAIEHHLLFPQKTNVEFASIAGPDHILLRVWERGAGPTLACGTGASAALVAAVLDGLTGRSARVTLPGGDLWIEWDAPSGCVFMTGPAAYSFFGEVEVDLLRKR